MKNEISNKKFAEEDKIFEASVEMANERGFAVEATKRQASKFRNKKGTAYRYSKAILQKKRISENEKTI